MLRCRPWRRPVTRCASPPAPDEVLAWFTPRLGGAMMAPLMLPELLAVVECRRPDLVIHETAAFAAPLADAEGRAWSVTVDAAEFERLRAASGQRRRSFAYHPARALAPKDSLRLTIFRPWPPTIVH